MTTATLVLIGFGNVARRFLQLLDERQDVLQNEHQLTWRIAGIATARHGCVVDPLGLDGARAAAVVGSGGRLSPDALGPSTEPCATALEVIERVRSHRPGRGVVVETTTLNVDTGEPAASHVRAALRAGFDVVSANKGPVACAYEELRELAARENRTFRFEGAVMDGIPIFNLVRETLPAVEILGFRGVVNSTTNYIICEMERGVAFAEALAAMQAQGIAEADASLDVEGWDAAAKTAALVNVLMRGRMRPTDVRRTGVASLTKDDVAAARAQGCRVRLVAEAWRTASGVAASVAPVLVPVTDPLAQLEGMANALVLQTDLLGEIAIVQRDGGLTQTAYALLSDLLSLRR
jgi:homoserine dehydrogenase